MDDRRIQIAHGPALPRPRTWLFWPSVVIALLAGQLLVSLSAVYIAFTDRSHAVLPDYYERAVDWDQHQAARRDSAALGWHTTWRIDDSADMFGQREVQLGLTDARGQAVFAEEVELVYFHHARAGRRATASMTSAGDGSYLATLAMREDGIWQIELTARRGSERFLATELRRVGSQRRPTKWAH